MAAVAICSDFGAQENKVCYCFLCFSIYSPWSDGTGFHDLSIWMLSFKPVFSLSFTFINRLFSSSLLSAIRVVSSALSVVIDISPCNLDSSLCFMLHRILSNYPLDLTYCYLSPFSGLCSKLCYLQLQFSSQLMCVENEMRWIDNQWDNMLSKVNKEIIKN